MIFVTVLFHIMEKDDVCFTITSAFCLHLKYNGGIFCDRCVRKVYLNKVTSIISTKLLQTESNMKDRTKLDSLYKKVINVKTSSNMFSFPSFCLLHSDKNGVGNELACQKIFRCWTLISTGPILINKWAHVGFPLLSLLHKSVTFYRKYSMKLPFHFDQSAPWHQWNNIITWSGSAGTCR